MLAKRVDGVLRAGGMVFAARPKERADKTLVAAHEEGQGSGHARAPRSVFSASENASATRSPNQGKPRASAVSASPERATST